jgi:membrane protein
VFATEKLKNAGAVAWGFVKHLAHRYLTDGCRESAAALTYMSLFALVPLLTLVYSVFSMVPAFQGLGDQVQSLIFKNFIPQSGLEVQQYLMDFSQQARKLSVVGALILVVTAYLMLTNIEKTFNRIWGTVGNRKGLSGFLLYWGILSFGPLLVGIGLMMHTYLISFQLIVDEVDALGVTALTLQYLPWLLTWMAFTLLFVAVPNTRVSFRYALVGGLLTAIMFQVAKSLFGTIVVNSNFHSVYGAFAIIPLFLFWIYLCWMIVLSGAELVRSLETFGVAYRGYRYPNLIAAIVVCWECWRRQQQGHTTSDRDINQAGINQQRWLELRAVLLRKRVLEITRNNQYVLTRDPSTLSLWEMAQFFGDHFARKPGTNASEKLTKYPWFTTLQPILDGVSAQAGGTLSITLGELFANDKTEE